MATIGPPTTGNSGVPTNPHGERDVREIRYPNGGSFRTRYSDDELAQINAMMARRRQEAAAASAALFPPPHVVAQREEEAWRTVRAAIPAALEAREALRQAHQVRGAAQREVDQRREVLERARQHRAAMQDELEQAEREEERKAAEAAKVVVLALAREQPVADKPPADPGGLFDVVGNIRRRRDQAQAAIAIISQDLAAAEGALRSAVRDVEKAAEVVAADRWLTLSDEIDAREAALERLVGRRRELGVTLTSGGKISRAAVGGLVRQLAVDAEADLG
jgi:hypothetical protein